MTGSLAHSPPTTIEQTRHYGTDEDHGHKKKNDAKKIVERKNSDREDGNTA